jgi:flagellar protein FliS
MTNPALRNRYLAESVATASPGRLLVMLYDRLLVDLAQGEEALRTGDRQAGSGHLLHAQDIIAELRGGLDLTVWEGAAGLAQLYGFIVKQLIQANVQANADLVAECYGLLEPLRDAWREALAATQAGGPGSAAQAVGARVG